MRGCACGQQPAALHVCLVTLRDEPAHCFFFWMVQAFDIADTLLPGLNCDDAAGSNVPRTKVELLSESLFVQPGAEEARSVHLCCDPSFPCGCLSLGLRRPACATLLFPASLPHLALACGHRA